MLAIAGQTAGSNGLTFFKETLEYPGGVKKTKKNQFVFCFKIRFFKIPRATPATSVSYH